MFVLVPLPQIVKSFLILKCLFYGMNLKNREASRESHYGYKNNYQQSLDITSVF